MPPVGLISGILPVVSDVSQPGTGSRSWKYHLACYARGRREAVP